MLPRPFPAILLLAALLLACAGRPQALAPSPEPAPPQATITAGPAVYLDQFRIELPLVLRVDNPGPGSLVVESLKGRLSSGQAALAEAELEGQALVVAAFSRASFPFSILIDLRKASLGPGPDLDWTLVSRLRLGRGGAGSIELSPGAAGRLALIREPSFAITYIVIEQDILVETAMRLVMEIDNPNAFPVELRSFTYRLYGEGKTWASGTSPETLMIPASGSMTKEIGFTMNFADMDRRLFDLVARQRLVSYRLTGEARIETGLAALPAFVAAFDRSGRSEVRK